MSEVQYVQLLYTILGTHSGNLIIKITFNSLDVAHYRAGVEHI